mmetsp:Transcript_32180/g.96994  ORF Transcript_32180/g.96994 Transcript_32180/m.96994 type:complete len:381 (+) Transcript_32180:326-1468(+)
MIPLCNVVGAGARQSQLGSRASALLAGASKAAVLVSLLRLGFGGTMATALWYMDPVVLPRNESKLANGPNIVKELCAEHPAMLSWAGVSAVVLLQAVILLAGTRSATPRSRYPFAVLKAVNCLWCLGATLTVLSAYLWVLALTSSDGLPSGMGTTRVVAASVAGVWATVAATHQLWSDRNHRGTCGVVFTNLLASLAGCLVVALTALDYDAWSPDSVDIDDNTITLREDLLRMALPVLTAAVAAFVVLLSIQASSSAIRLNHARLRALGAAGDLAINAAGQHGGNDIYINLGGGYYGDRPIPRRGAVRRVHPPHGYYADEVAVPPRYAEPRRQMVRGGAHPGRATVDGSNELMEAAELIAVQGLPPSYVEAVSESEGDAR